MGKTSGTAAQLNGNDTAQKKAAGRLPKTVYEAELAKMQVELVKLQEWIKHQNLKVVVIFEGRDAAGTGGSIKRITQSLSPRVCRVVALPAPTERERTQCISSAMYSTCLRPGKWY